MRKTILLLLLSMIGVAYADTNLISTCLNPAIAGTTACGADKRWDVPSSDAVPVSTYLITGTKNYFWKPWGQVAAGDLVWACSADIPRGSLDSVCPADQRVQIAKPAVEPPPVIEPPPVVEPPPVIEPPPIEVGQNVVRLRWTLPTKNTDGSALTDLAGVKIYSGTQRADGSAPTADELQLLRTIASPTATEVSLPDYGWGKFYFAVSAYNAALRESVRSNVLSAEFVKPATTPEGVTGVTVEVQVTWP